MSLTDTRHQRSAALIMVAKASFMVACSLMSLGITLVRRRSSSKAALGQVGGPHPDAVAHWDAVDGEQRLAVVSKAGHGRGEGLA